MRDLLLAAPIRAAANNQRQVLRHQVMEGQQPAERRLHLVRVAECLERLRRAGGQREAARAPWSPAAANESRPLVFEVYDLYDEGKSLGRLPIEAALELQVEPQSVRAVKLIEG